MEPMFDDKTVGKVKLPGSGITITKKQNHKVAHCSEPNAKNKYDIGTTDYNTAESHNDSPLNTITMAIDGTTWHPADEAVSNCFGTAKHYTTNAVKIAKTIDKQGNALVTTWIGVGEWQFMNVKPQLLEGSNGGRFATLRPEAIQGNARRKKMFWFRMSEANHGNGHWQFHAYVTAYTVDHTTAQGIRSEVGAESGLPWKRVEGTNRHYIRPHEMPPYPFHQGKGCGAGSAPKRVFETYQIFAQLSDPLSTRY